MTPNELRNPFGLTVKDVRKLHVCCLCQQLGIHQPEHPELEVPLVVCIHSTETNPLTVPKKSRTFCHPRCYIKAMGVAKLLTLHADEIGSIRMGDVSPVVIQRILGELLLRGLPGKA